MAKRKPSKPETNDIADELEQPDPEADERVRLLRKELAAAHRKISDMTANKALIIEEVGEILDGMKFVIDVPPAPRVDRRKKREEIPILHIGDCHFGHYHSHGPHAYSVDIGKRRMHMAADKFLATIQDRRQSASIQECHLYLMGDIVEGEALRKGHAHEIEGPVIKQAIFWAPEALASLVVKLMSEFRKVVIKAVPGNHGRNGPPRGDSHPMTNWDRVAYQVTRMMVDSAILQKQPKRASDIAWDLPTDRYETHHGDDWYAIDYVFDWCCCLLHGEDLRGKGWGGIPFYGVERMARRYADIVDDPIDYLSLGHIHVDATIPSNYRTILVNGAIESSTTYARKQLVSSTSPSQKAVFFSPEQGLISQHTLYLGEERLPQGRRVERAINARHKNEQ